MQPHDELDFIKRLDEDQRSMLKKSDWLLTDFDEHEWSVSFDHIECLTINWRVQVDNGLLTSKENIELLESLKYFLLIAVDSEGLGSRSSIRKQRRNFSEALTIIDYFLLNSETLELTSAGLAGLSQTNLTGLLVEFSTHPYTSESIYKYNPTAEFFFLQITAETPASVIANIFMKFPSIKDVSEDQINSDNLSLNPEIIPAIRAALYHHGYYSGNLGQGYHLNGKRLSEELYPNTIGGTRIKPRLHWLSFYPFEKTYRRELDNVPVRYLSDGKVSLASYNSFRATLYRLGVLNLINASAPPASELVGITDFIVPVGADKTFRSVPSPIVLKQFKECVEFHFKYGKNIIDGFCRVAAYCKSSGIPIHQIPEKKIRNIIGPELIQLGVKRLGLACKQLNATKFKPPREDYYANLRQNEGLIELVQIYIGSAQFVLGTLMARRYNELTDLPLLTCLDQTKEWLISNIEKTSRNLFGVRDVQGRPIDPLPVAMIRLLVRMQRLLKRFGVIDSYKRLFSTPSTLGYKGLIDASTESWNRNLDIIADYFQTGTDKYGRRYYIRQHQLRRFFALIFFHTYGYGGMNAIRWMLGHQDIEQVYRYIKANIDGASLRGAMAQAVLEDMSKGGVENYQNLSELLKARFGTATFGLYDELEAEQYIQSQMQRGSIVIEPVFFTDEHGKQMKLVVQIFEKDL
jgi:hypothetical protein